MKINIFVIFNDIIKNSISQNIGSHIYSQYTVYNVLKKDIQKIFNKINNLDDEDYVWIVSENIIFDNTMSLKDYFTDIVLLNSQGGIFLDKERLSVYPLKNTGISNFIVKSKLLKGIKYSYKSVYWINKYLFSILSTQDKIYLEKFIITDKFLEEDKILEDLKSEKDEIFLSKVLNENPTIYKNNLEFIKEKFPFTLSIIVIFCDKDFKYLNEIYTKIRKNIENIEYEIILMDNRESNKEPISFINNADVIYVNMGGNKRQFAARIESVKYISKRYTMFIDGDDNINKISSKDIYDFYPLVDTILYNYETTVFGKKIIFNPQSRHNIKYICVTDDLYNILHKYDLIVLWEKFIRSDILKKSFQNINSNLRIICNEDSILSYNLFNYTNIIQFSDKVFYINNAERGLSTAEDLSYDKYIELSTGFFEGQKLLKSLINKDSYIKELVRTIKYLLGRLNCIKENIDGYNIIFSQIQFLLNNSDVMSIFLKNIIYDRNTEVIKKLMLYLSRRNNETNNNSYSI